ncbi:hypothetical protein QQ045_002131 [Rhodiola kirilowii]
MYAVGRIGSYISRGVDTVAAPFHPFGGAVDMIVVQQLDGSLRSSPWYVRFGKFQGVLKTKDKVVSVTVNGVDAAFHMYLDHKGKAYFLNEVDVEEKQEAVLYHSSSGEDTDNQSRSKRVTKYECFKAEVKQQNSGSQADGRDECKRELGAWSSSRRARILGLVFGSRSFKENVSQKSPEDEELKRARLLERAEIAADLLELKWSTTLPTKKLKKNVTLNSSLHPVTTESNNDVVMDIEKSLVSSIVPDKMEHDIDHGELVNGNVLVESSDSLCDCMRDIAETKKSDSLCDCMRDIAETTERIYGPKSLIEYSVFVAQESSHSIEIPGTKENVGGFGNDLSADNPDGSNLVLDSNSVIGIRLVTDDLADIEMSEVIHPTDVVISRTDEDGNMKMEDAHVSGYISRQTCSSSSCISEEGVVEPEVITTFDQSYYQTNYSKSCGIKEEEVAESSLDNADSQHIENPARCKGVETPSESSNEDQCAFSVLDDSRLAEVHNAKSTSTHWKSGATCGDSDHPKKVFNNLTCESFSSPEKLDQQNVANHFEEHVGISSHTHQLVDVYDKTWGIWPFTFKRSRSMKSSKLVSRSPRNSQSCSYPNGTSKQDGDTVERNSKVTKKKIKTVIPTSEQLASLNLKEGRNEVTFTFSTAMLGDQKVDAKIYVWKWNARIVISDVDGTITRSDVLGQVMPLVGMDWSHIGVAQLFSAIKENGYNLLFLSARAISQAYHTKQFLFNLKQNGQALPDGPVVISPDGLFPSLFREVIRRAPHEFKIACLEDIKACFPTDCNPFYAGFGNRDTDEFSYLKVGIPKGKIFIINPKGEVAVHRCLDTKSYTSLHALVNDIFPPTSTTEQEDFNSWNFWKLPPLTQ